MVPDMEKRNTMNLIVLAAATPVVGGLGLPYLYFFFPKGSGGAGGGVAAKDALGNDVKIVDWVKAHPYPTRSLAQGLKGDPTYLVVTQDGGIETYGINAVCTHLGCVVPWNKVDNKFKCPCHGSQYDKTGKVVRGPAPLSLAMAHTADTNGVVTLTPWTETDFRTGDNPWWK
jgi:cytochrome b6-f complex iron-sulfur subunit